MFTILGIESFWASFPELNKASRAGQTLVSAVPICHPIIKLLGGRSRCAFFLNCVLEKREMLSGSSRRRARLCKLVKNNHLKENTE